MSAPWSRSKMSPTGENQHAGSGSRTWSCRDETLRRAVGTSLSEGEGGGDPHESWSSHSFGPSWNHGVAAHWLSVMGCHNRAPCARILREAPTAYIVFAFASHFSPNSNVLTQREFPGYPGLLSCTLHM